MRKKISESKKVDDKKVAALLKFLTKKIDKAILKQQENYLCKITKNKSNHKLSIFNGKIWKGSNLIVGNKLQDPSKEFLEKLKKKKLIKGKNNFNNEGKKFIRRNKTYDS